ncbi:MAG: helix-turn-helix transcriptional regulator [Myxococcales bacterium]|nr:helix-turn-helix transcriptional regulator [Myxococcales bacterium]
MQLTRFDDASPVFPDGRCIRRLRHARGWSRRELCTAIAHASRRATGIGEALTPNLIAGVEEHGESVSYTTLCLIASGLDCDPIEILLP